MRPTASAAGTAAFRRGIFYIGALRRGGFYRPRSEVLRMLTAGEAWGTAGAALLVLPLTADTAAAAALRNWLGRRQLEAAACSPRR